MPHKKYKKKNLAPCIVFGETQYSDIDKQVEDGKKVLEKDVFDKKPNKDTKKKYKKK